MHVVTPHASVPVRTTVGIVATMVVVATMSAIVRTPNNRTAVVEVATIVITIDREVPTACTPDDGAEEVVGSRQQIVLPVVQDAAQVAQAIAVVAAIDVGRRINPKEVIEVDFVGIVILLVVEVELIGHLVRQVESLCLCTLKTHCIGAYEGCHHKHQGKHNLLHSCIVLYGFTSV